MARPFVNLSDSFKILRDKLNTVSYNVGDPDDLNTYGDSDVVQAINEIERVFDASSGEILYPTGSAGETQTRLLISTNQSSGTDVQINVGANFNVDAVGDINLDAGGANINFLDDSVNRIAFTLGATNTVGVTGILDLDVSSNLDVDVSGNSTITSTGTATHEATTFTVDASGDVILDADGGNVTFKDGGVTEYNFATDGTISRTGDLTLDITGDIVLDADGANITYKDGGTTRIAYTMGATNTAAVTGNLTYDVSGDIVLDAGTNNIDLKGAGTTRFAYGLGTSNTLDVTGNLTQTVSGNFSDSANGTYHIGATGLVDVVTSGNFDTTSNQQTHITSSNYSIDAGGDITLDADGGTVYLKDNATQFGRLENSGNQLDIYSGSTLAFQMTANTIEVHNRAFFLDSALDTTAQNVAGSVNEIHTQLDSAVSEIEVTKNTIESMLRVFDSGGTGVNISATGISTLNTLDKTFVGSINEIDTRLDSAVSEIEVVKTTVVGIIADVNALDTRVGPLSELDSATAGGFFDSAGTAGSIVKALNELARRTVLIYDESGTLLN